jgi:hypothetical protein
VLLEQLASVTGGQLNPSPNELAMSCPLFEQTVSLSPFDSSAHPLIAMANPADDRANRHIQYQHPCNVRFFGVCGGAMRQRRGIPGSQVLRGLHPMRLIVLSNLGRWRG